MKFLKLLIILATIVTTIVGRSHVGVHHKSKAHSKTKIYKPCVSVKSATTGCVFSFQQVDHAISEISLGIQGIQGEIEKAGFVSQHMLKMRKAKLLMEYSKIQSIVRSHQTFIVVDPQNKKVDVGMFRHFENLEYTFSVGGKTMKIKAGADSQTLPEEYAKLFEKAPTTNSSRQVVIGKYVMKVHSYHPERKVKVEKVCVPKNLRTSELCDELWNLGSIPCYTMAWEYNNLIGRSMKLMKYNSYYVDLNKYRDDPKSYPLYFNSFIVPKGVVLKITYVQCGKDKKTRTPRQEEPVYKRLSKLSYTDEDCELYLNFEETDAMKPIAQLPELYRLLLKIRVAFKISYNANLEVEKCRNELKNLEDERDTILIKIDSLNDEIQNLHSQKFKAIYTSEQILAIAKKDQAVIDFDKQITEKEAQIAASQKEIERIQGLIDTYKKQIETNIQTMESITATNILLTKEKNGYDAQVTAYEADILENDELIRNNEWRIKDSKTKQQSIKDEIEALNKKLALEEERNKQLDEKKVLLTGEGEKLIMLKKTTEDKVKDVTATITTNTSKISNLKTTNTELRSKITIEEKSRDTEKDKKNDLNDELKDLQEKKAERIQVIIEEQKLRNEAIEKEKRENQNKINVAEGKKRIEQANKVEKQTEIASAEQNCKKVEAVWLATDKNLQAAEAEFIVAIQGVAAMLKQVVNDDSIYGIVEDFLNPNLSNDAEVLEALAKKKIMGIYNDLIPRNIAKTARRYRRMLKKLRRMRLI